MKRLGKILFIFIALFIFSATGVKADDSDIITEIEGILQEKLDEKFNDGNIKITLADSVLRSDYDREVKDGTIDPEETSYEEYAMRVVYEAEEVFYETVFGDDIEIDTGFTRDDGTKIIAKCGIDSKNISVPVPNRFDDHGYQIYEMQLVPNVIMATYSFELSPYRCDDHGENCSGTGASIVEKELTVEMNFVKADTKISEDIEYYRKEMAKVETLEYRDLYWINMLLATNLSGF